MKRSRPCANLIVMVATITLSGCVSSKYQSAPKDSRPPRVLNLTKPGTSTTTTPSPFVEATLYSVIAFHGPGSWKSEAYWDEYVLTIVNRGAAPLSLDSAALVDFQKNAGSPGANPWELETQSRQYVANIAKVSGDILELGNGAEPPIDVAGAVGQTVGAYYGVAAVGLALTATPIGLPIYAASALFLNNSRKHHIEEEFDRRRLKLPLTVAPGATVQGSLFFPIAPGPQRLTLHCRGGEEKRDLAIELGPLKGLHLKSTPAPTQ